MSIGLRLSAEVAGVSSSRFGLSIENGEADAAIARLVSVAGVELAGFHLHLKGDTDDPSSYRDAARRLAAFVESSRPIRLDSIDLGGGFPLTGRNPAAARDGPPADRGVRQAIAEGSRQLFPGHGARR